MVVRSRWNSLGIFAGPLGAQVGLPKEKERKGKERIDSLFSARAGRMQGISEGLVEFRAGEDS